MSSSKEKQRLWIVYYPETSAGGHLTRIAEGLADNFDVNTLRGNPGAVRHFKKGDRVLVVTTPPIMPFIVAIASLFRGAAYSLLIHDGKARNGIIEYFDRWLYKYTAKIIIVGRDILELIEPKTAGLDIPIEVIPSWTTALERYRLALK